MSTEKKQHTPTEEEGFILSENCTVFTDEGGIKGNVCFLGGCGTGKTWSGIKANLSQLNSSCVVTDPHGVLTSEMGHLFEEAGYRIKIYNTMDLCKSMQYNPFRYIKSDDDVLKLVDAFLYNSKDSTAEMLFKKLERLCLSAIVGFVVDYGKPEEKNFSTVMTLIKKALACEPSAELNSFDILFKMVAEGTYYDKKHHQETNPDTGEVDWVAGWTKNPNQKAQPDAFCVRQYEKFTNSCDAKTQRSVLESLALRFAIIDCTEFHNTTAEDELALDEIADQKTVLFVNYSPSSNEPLAFLDKVLIEQTYSSLLMKNKIDTDLDVLLGEDSGKLPVVFFLDEYAAEFSIEDFPKILAVGPQRGVSTVFTLQSISQLQHLYEVDETNAILDNCKAVVWLSTRHGDLLSLNGTVLADARIVMPPSEKETAGFFKRTKNRVGSIEGYSLPKIIELPPLGLSECYVLHHQPNGMVGFIDRKYNLEKHPNYALHGALYGKGDCENLFDVEKFIKRSESHKLRVIQKLEHLVTQREKLNEQIAALERLLQELA